MGTRAFGRILAALICGATCVTWVDGQTQEKPAATVNGDAIAMAEVRAILDIRPSPVPLTKEQQKELRQAALDMLIDDVLMRQFLRKNSGPIQQADIAKEIDELRDALKKQNQTIDQFLRQGKQTMDQLKADITARLQWKNYLATRFPEAELKNYYEANKVFFDKVFVRASHILVKVAANAPASEKQAAKAKLETLRQEIQTGKIKFEDAAKKYSDCPSKDKGGDIGQFPCKFVVVEAFSKAAFSMKKGEISDVVTTDFGYHIILVTDRTAGENTTFQAMKESVRETMAQEMDLYQQVLAEQRKAAKIEKHME